MGMCDFADCNEHSLCQENKVKEEKIMNVEPRNALNMGESTETQQQEGAKIPALRKQCQLQRTSGDMKLFQWFLGLHGLP